MFGWCLHSLFLLGLEHQIHFLLPFPLSLDLPLQSTVLARVNHRPYGKPQWAYCKTEDASNNNGVMYKPSRSCTWSSQGCNSHQHLFPPVKILTSTQYFHISDKLLKVKCKDNHAGERVGNLETIRMQLLQGIRKDRRNKNPSMLHRDKCS